MKIAMITPKFYPDIGGVEKHVLRVSEELINRGYEITVITKKQNVSTLEVDKHNAVTLYRIPCTRIHEIWLWLFKNRDILKRADIIHCHDFGTFIFWYLPFRVLYPKKPVFITFHGFEGIIPIPRTIVALRKMTEKLTKGNICIGDFIPKWYGTKPTMVLYGGVDLPKNLDQANTSKPDQKKMIYIGRLEEDTGVKEYISALVILKSKYNLDIPGYICGDGSLRSTIQSELTTHGLKHEMLGFVQSPEEYLQNCQFAFVSGYLAILEAMAYRKMVLNISTNALKNDYLRLIPNADAIMVTVDSPEELAERIAYYYNHPSTIDKFTVGARKFAEEHSWESVTDGYVRLWQSQI